MDGTTQERQHIGSRFSDPPASQSQKAFFQDNNALILDTEDRRLDKGLKEAMFVEQKNTFNRGGWLRFDSPTREVSQPSAP